MTLDNIIVVVSIKKKKGAILASFNKLEKDIWDWTKGQDIWITAYHVPGVKNTLSDLRSLFYNNKEWYLNKRVAKSLFDQFGKPEIDLSASHLNTKCSKYASYKPDPDAYHVNAFSLCCLNLNSNIFPPFSIAGRVLQTCTGLGDSLGDSSLLANTTVVPTICAVGNHGQHCC